VVDGSNGGIIVIDNITATTCIMQLFKATINHQLQSTIADKPATAIGGKKVETISR